MATIDDQENPNQPIIDFYDLIETFIHNQRLNAAFNKKQSSETIGGINSSGVFTTAQNGQETVHKERDQRGTKTCLFGVKNKFDECFYFNFKNTKKPASFTFKKEVFDKVNQNLKAAYMVKVKAYVTNKLEYDLKFTPNLAMKKSDSLQTKEISEAEESTMQMGSFINHLLLGSTSSFSVDQSPNYYLLRNWVLDGDSDIHICNKSMYHLCYRLRAHIMKFGQSRIRSPR